ncbi:ATP-binding protein [Verrucomicrobiota bacterium]
MSNLQESMFAPDERADSESVSRDAKLLMQSALLVHLTEAIPCILLILNKERQIVFENKKARDSLSLPSGAEILGTRHGEMVNCIHASQSPGGCGTNESCRWCGVRQAIFQSQDTGTTVLNECRILTANGKSYEFTVRASPYTLENRKFTILSLLDISDRKRRHALEQTFFHDVNNILMTIVGFSEILETSILPDDTGKSIDMIKEASKELIAQITIQKKLLQAEDGELALQIENRVSSMTLVEELIRMSTNMWRDRRILQGEQCHDFVISTDRTLLHRVLFNMVKNAVEASSQGEAISISYFRDDSSGVFGVHNPGFMPRSTQTQLFKRSFSTKGKGRGIGTYSMKLFGERYLKGKVWFSTSETEGTTFFISLPLL